MILEAGELCAASFKYPSTSAGHNCMECSVYTPHAPHKAWCSYWKSSPERVASLERWQEERWQEARDLRGDDQC